MKIEALLPYLTTGKQHCTFSKIGMRIEFGVLYDLCFKNDDKTVKGTVGWNSTKGSHVSIESS